MPPLTNRIEIDRSPGNVFAYATDPLRFPEWQADVLGVRFEEEGRPTVGTRFTHHAPDRPLRAHHDRGDHRGRPALRRWAARGVGAARSGRTREISLESIQRRRVAGDVRARLRRARDRSALVPVVRQIAAKGAQESHRKLTELLENRD